MNGNKDLKQSVTLPVDETNEGYEMSFSDDNQGKGNSGNNDRNNKNENRSSGSRGFWPIIILIIIFSILVILILYFFVFRTSNSSVSYSDNDVVYNIDADGDGDIDQDENGYPDFTTYDTTTSFSSKIVETEYSQTGDLAYMLINPASYSIQFNVVSSNTTSQITYLTGTYTTLVDGKTQTVKFTATLHTSIYYAYVDPIIRYVTVTDTSGNNLPYYVTGKTYYVGIESTTDTSWILPLIMIVLMVVLVIIFVNSMYKSLGAGSNQMSGFVNNVARKSNGSKVRFSDVAGCDEAKAELVELVDYFHSTDKYTRLGAKLPHGVLLVGPPGTGKTLLAKAVAGEANVPFYSISGSDFVEMYVGVGASRVRSLFKTAKQNAPCLIFIDEIDAVGRQRGAGLGGGNDEREQTLNELLVEMDGFEDNNGVIVMAATNRSDILDPALTRPGRFDRTITVDLPDKQGRAAILKVHSRNKKLAPDVNFESIASRTVGFSGADLANIMNDAAILAVRANRSAITTADIDEAIDRAISGPAKRSHLEPAERKQVAYHEAGHAVIGIFLPYSDKVQKITIIPRGRTGGHVLMTPENDRFLMTKNQLLARITGYLGGRVSEEIFFGDVSTGASNDIEVATQLARSMVTEYGMSDLGPIQYEKPGGSVFLGRDYNSTQANYSTQIAFEIDKQIRLIIDQCHDAAKKLLEEHKDDVVLIANTLIENETITADQIDYLLKNRKLPPVDEHKLGGEEGINPKNPQNIILYPGYEHYYHKIDEILEGNPCRLVIVVAIASGTPINDNAFQSACVSGAKDPSRIGILFVDYSESVRISTTVETFAEHLESYAGVPVRLMKTDDRTVHHLEGKYQPPKKEAPVATTAPTVTDKPVEEKKDDTTESPKEDEKKEETTFETKDETEKKDDTGRDGE